MKPYHLIAIFAALPVMAQTQLLTFGVKGGVPAQTPLGQTDSRMPYVVGPTVTVRFFSRFSLESGVLFHRMGQTLTTGVFQYPESAVTIVSGAERGRAVEVPILAKAYLLGERHTWRPFITAGPTLRRTSLKSRNYSTILSGASLTTLTAQPALERKQAKWNVDPVFGAGVDFKAGRFHLEPEVRYSYWGAGKNSTVRKNQVEFLLGFRF